MEAPVRPAAPAATDESRLTQLMKGMLEVTAATTRAEVLQRAANLAVQVFQAESAVITVLADGGERFESYSSPGQRRELPDTAPFLGVPLACHGIVRGSLYLTGTPQSSFTVDDEHLAVILTGCAATTLDRLDWTAERARLTSSHDRLLTTISHDLGNALTAIYGWGDILVRRTDPDAVPRPAYELLAAAEGAIGLLHDTVDLTRLEFRDLVPALASVPSSEIFENVVSRGDATARTRGVELKQETGSASPRIRTDRRRLEQLLVHLLLDQVEQAAEGSAVRVRSSVDGSDLIITIEPLDPVSGNESPSRHDTTNPNRGLALWQRIGALIGASVTVPHGPRSRPGYRVAVAIA